VFLSIAAGGAGVGEARFPDELKGDGAEDDSKDLPHDFGLTRAKKA